MSTTKPPPLRRPLKAAEFPPLPLVSGGTLQHRIQVLIQRMISEKVLRGGDYLPGEMALAEHWDVDRQTTHRALRALKGDAWIVSAPGVGWYVPYGLSQDELDAQFEVYASPEDPQVLRVVVGEESIFELDFRNLEHGSAVGEVPAEWRRMVVSPD